MNIDDLVKLLLAISFSIAIVGISIQIMRLIGKLSDSIQDLRRAIQNVSTASDMVVEDYGRIRKLLNTVMSTLENFEQNVLSPVRSVTGFIQKFTGGKDVEAVEAEEPEDEE